MKIKFTLIFLLAALTLQASEVVYTADNTTIFPNPERGFISQLSKVVTAADPYVVYGRESYLTSDKRLILVLYYLNNFKDNPTLPTEILNAFDADMQALRSNGFKCILRFAYSDTHADNNDGYGDTGDDAPLSVIESHIAQLKSHWEANADVIYVMQAGFVGTYGEWYYTKNFGNKEGGMNAARIALLDTVLKAMPDNRFLLLRTPAHKIGYMGDENTLTSAEAFTGSTRARLGHYNDAVLNFPGDAGTYSIKRNGESSSHTDTTTLKPYVASETMFVPIGGESNVTNEEAAATNATYEKTTAEFSRLHWSFCKGGWPEAVVNKWKAEGTYDELDRKLGYRFQLVSASLPDEAENGENAHITLQIRNTGYAPLYNERHAYIVFKNSSIGTYMVQLQSNPRRWSPNGAVTIINEEITMPSDIPAGTYKMYLYMPDASATIASDSRYAIRFANSNMWVESTGMNRLNAEVTVYSDIPAPAPIGIALPATLNKTNVTAKSADMTWYASDADYFDFGPTDAANTSRWADWTVYLRYPGKYILSEVMISPRNKDNTAYLTHQWQLTLQNEDDDIISIFSLPKSSTSGVINYSSSSWNLSDVAQGTYTLRLMNINSWAQPKIKSLTLTYDGELPTGTEQITIIDRTLPMYDLLGRQVRPSYRGIVIQNNRKFILFDN